jgi:hypothetical protein
MNERAMATGLNTGTSGQIALAQNMAYQNNLGNLYAQQAQNQAESDLAMANLLREYNAGVNQATATSNAQLAQALYNEMIRQEELAAAQAAAQAEAERYQREWDYKVKQDELDRQLAYAKLYSGGNGTPKEAKPTLTYDQMMKAIDAGNVTPNVKDAYLYYMGNEYNPIQSVTQLGDLAKNLYDRYTSTGGGLTTARKADLMDANITNDELNYILDALGVK